MQHRKVALVDGTQLLYRAEYGFPSRIRNRHDQDVTGTFGFFALLRKALQDSPVQPTHALVIFDADAPLERQAADSRYKSERQNLVQADGNPFGHLAAITRGLRHLEMAAYEDSKAEADDVIATVIKRDLQSDATIVISRDKDFFQLVSEAVSMWDPASGRARGWNTPATIVDKFGVSPGQWTDYLSLVGDRADNMPGVKGIGPITARRILSQYAHLENIPPNVLAQEKTRLALKQREIHKLRRNVKLGELEYSRVTPKQIPPAAAILDKLGTWDEPIYPVTMITDASEKS